MKYFDDAPTPARISIKWGGISGIGIAIYDLIMRFLVLDINPSLNKFIYLMMLVAFIFCMYKGINKFKEFNKGQITFGQAFGINFLLTGIAAIIYSLILLIYNLANASKTGNIYQHSGTKFISTFITTLIFGFIISIVVSAIKKNNKPVFE